MPDPTCGEVRQYLGGLSAGTPLPVASDTWDTLLQHGAVAGSSSAPTLTPVGKHVLAELEVRAYRTDTLPLTHVAGQLTRVLGDMDTVAKTAEYFLAELGPVTPPEALRLLRPIAVGLANRRETPEELAEEFRNVWGSVEVMGGDARDRLLAAALLHAGGMEMEKIYSPMMNGAAAVREVAGPRAPAVTVSALLHLNPKPNGQPPMEEYLALRKTTRTEDGAAMLAATGRPPAEVLRVRGQILERLAGGRTPSPDEQVAAGYLTVCGAQLDHHLPRMDAMVRALGNRFPNPIVVGAILSMIDWLEPAELVNWLDKATETARQRKLGPASELPALGLTIVLGLPPAEFATSTMKGLPRLVQLANVLAVNAWLYGGLAPPAPAAGAP